MAQRVEFPAHKRPTTNVGLAPLLGTALIITVVLFGVLWPFAERRPDGTVAQPFIRDLFIGYDVQNNRSFYPDRIIFQGLITYVWALSITYVILKRGRVAKERKFVEENVVPDNLDFHNDEQILQAFERVRSHPSLTDSICLTRLARVLAVWINSRDSEHTKGMAKEEAEFDAYSSDSTYRLNRLFVWALPVLGFIGTVYGVSLAVSNFAGFLQGDVTPEAIKNQVGLITTGLGVAFYTTLLGLIFATIAAFSSLLMERTEEGVLDEVTELVEGRILLRLPTAAEQAEEGGAMEKMVQAIREGMEGIQANLRFPVDELAQAIDAGFRRLPNPDRYEEVFTRAISKAADLINQKYEEFQTNYERRVAELGSQLGGKLEQVAANFNSGTNRIMDEFRKTQEKNLEVFARNEQKLAEKFDELTEQIATLGKEQVEAFGEAHERYLEAVQELDRKEIQRWEKMVADFNQLSQRLSENFTRSVQVLDNSSQRYAEQIRASSQALAEQLENITKIGAEIDKVLRTVQTMEATVRNLGNSDEFRQTWNSMRNQIDAATNLMKELSRPRKVVFQETRLE
ncbi:MAG: MotA/TolQ/ExbB proton channel family protein [Verrucomicrobiae bacterium]|nr:MotA/TolQ/ExbB proton channel family protein [Verrucomicrobiae bacterium]